LNAKFQSIHDGRIRPRIKTPVIAGSALVMVLAPLPKQTIPTEKFVEIAHGRWDIENKAFNEMTTFWHADHVYKHTANAIEAFWLVTMLAYNLFHAFITLNLKPAIRQIYTKLHLARAVAAELYTTNDHLANCRAP